MIKQIQMTAKGENHPVQIQLQVSEHEITLVKYLPNITYYDISDKLDRDLIHLFPVSNRDVKGVIFFAPAMAVPQLFYKYFLDYLSSLGFLVISLDYLDIGLSSTGSMQGSTTAVHEWIDDLEASTNWLLDNYRDILGDLDLSPGEIDQLPLYYLCHSLGGQLFGMISTQNRFDKFVAVTSQNGYWRYYTNKWRYFLFWHFLASPLTRIFRYFPGSKLGFGEDLPPKVMLRWKKWCTSKDYFFDDPDYGTQFELYVNRMLTIGFVDDPWATEPSINNLYDHYSNAEREHWHLTPEEFGLKEVGHFGFFKPQSVRLWQKTFDWLVSEKYRPKK